MSLHIEQLRFARKDFALGPIELTLPAGRRSVLLGPSGCGKTTLLRLIAGLETPSAGSIRFGETRFHDARSSLPPQRRDIGFVFQNMALWPHMRARKQVQFAGRCSKEDADRWLARVGLGDKGDRLPGELSGGEGGRLALARALAQGPRLLLLDEPLRSVDPHLREGLQHIIRELSDELQLTTITVTHDRDEALALGDELVLMDEGTVIESGSADDLFESPRTSFAASFLRNARLLPVRREGSMAATPWGLLPVPPTLNGHQSVALALVPQDLSVTEGDGDDVVVGRVLDQYRSPAGWIAEVEVQGHTLHVGLASRHRGDSAHVHLRLRSGAPLVHLLPSREPESHER